MVDVLISFNLKFASTSTNGIIQGLQTLNVPVFSVIRPYQDPLTHGGRMFLHTNNVFDEEFQSHFGYPDDGVRFLSGFNLTI